MSRHDTRLVRAITSESIESEIKATLEKINQTTSAINKYITELSEHSGASAQEIIDKIAQATDELSHHTSNLDTLIHDDVLTPDTLKRYLHLLPDLYFECALQYKTLSEQTNLKPKKTAWGKKFRQHLNTAVRYGNIAAMKLQFKRLKKPHAREHEEIRFQLLSHYLIKIVDEQICSESTYEELNDLLEKSSFVTKYHYLKHDLQNKRGLHAGFLILRHTIKNNHHTRFTDCFSQLKLYRQLSYNADAQSSFYLELALMLISLTADDLDSACGKVLFEFCRSHKDDLFNALNTFPGSGLTLALKSSAIISVLYSKRNGIFGTKPSVKRHETKIAKLYNKIYESASTVDRKAIKALLSQHEKEGTTCFEPATPKSFSLFSTPTAPAKPSTTDKRYEQKSQDKRDPRQCRPNTDPYGL